MGKNNNSTFMIQLSIVVILGVLLLYNLSIPKVAAPQAQTSASSGQGSSAIMQAIIPTGVPAVYGAELGISFDDVSVNSPSKADATIRKLGGFDDGIQLSAADKTRYINILYNMENGISCEYCCGARAVIFETGEAACGCAHSYAMRGLTKYLLTKHGAEYSDAQILEEVGKWKVLFFPGILASKAQVLQNQGIELNYINLASNKFRGIEQGQSTGGSMVGGC